MNNTMRYGNLVSGMLADTKAKPDATIGTDATIISGRDRHPARIVDIVRAKSGAVVAYILQRYQWTGDGTGYAAVIHWDKPACDPARHDVVTRGRMKGTVRDAFIGEARAFYDLSF